jgi:hypothetical protein
MARTNWKKIADAEFNSMDKEARDQWSELRERTTS